MAKLQTGRRFGWHSGTVHCKNIIVESNMTISGNLNFGDASADTLSVTGLMTVTQTAMTENTMAVSVSGAVTDATHGARQGAIYIYMNRAVNLTSWDGNPDCALKIQCYNRGVSGANGGTRGIDVTARNRDSGTESWINAIYATAENSANTIVSAYVAQFIMKNNGIVSTSHYGVVVQDTSQGTGPADTVLLKITTGTIAPASGIRNMALQITSADSTGYTNGISLAGPVTNALDFASIDGTNGATYSAGHYTSIGACDGKIRVDVGGNTLYIPAYVSIAA